MTGRGFTDNDVRTALLNAYQEAGSSYAELSRRAEVSDEYVRQTVLGQRPVRGRLLAFLGFERITRYRSLGGGET